MAKIRVWVEVMTTTRFTEETFDVPDDWDQMTEAERENYMCGYFEDMRDNIANGGYEVTE